MGDPEASKILEYIPIKIPKDPTLPKKFRGNNPVSLPIQKIKHSRINDD